MLPNLAEMGFEAKVSNSKQKFDKLVTLMESKVSPDEK